MKVKHSFWTALGKKRSTDPWLVMVIEFGVVFFVGWLLALLIYAALYVRSHCEDIQRLWREVDTSEACEWRLTSK